MSSTSHVEQPTNSMNEATQNDETQSPAVEESKSPAEEEMDDLFGDDDEDDDDDILRNRRQRKDVSDKEDDEEDSSQYGRSRSHGEDEEEAMYTRKFYGEDADNYSADEDDHAFKEEDVELVRHMVPYTTNSSEIKTGGDTLEQKDNEDNHIFYAKVPQFLTIDPVPFDPPRFEESVRNRLAQEASEEDKLGDRLVDENTIRWRYSRDANQRVFKESNAQIVKWSDGTYSLKLGEEYTDILVNDTDNTFLTVSHDKQELMQCINGGEINKTIMFIPTSTNSKIHHRLSKAVARRNKIEHDGPGTFLIQVDPEVEKKELETKQLQIMRERRRRQIKENELLDSGEATPDSFGRRSTPKASTSVPSRRSYQDDYEEDDFLVDDNDENEYEDEDEEQERDILDASEEEEDEYEEERRAERLKNMKRSSADFREDSAENEDDGSRKKSRAIISDDEDDE